jgi:hypothetical protein
MSGWYDPYSRTTTDNYLGLGIADAKQRPVGGSLGAGSQIVGTRLHIGHRPSQKSRVRGTERGCHKQTHHVQIHKTPYARLAALR